MSSYERLIFCYYAFRGSLHLKQPASRLRANVCLWAGDSATVSPHMLPSLQSSALLSFSIVTSSSVSQHPSLGTKDDINRMDLWRARASLTVAQGNVPLRHCRLGSWAAWTFAKFISFSCVFYFFTLLCFGRLDMSHCLPTVITVFSVLFIYTV